MSTEAEFLQAYGKIHASYKIVMEQIDEAISHEENDRPLEAIAAYEISMNHIEKTFAIPVGLPENISNVEKAWLDACKCIQNLKGVKADITYRLKVLRSKHSPIDGAAKEAAEGNNFSETDEPLPKKKSNLLENPSTYYDINNATGTPKTYREIIKGLREVVATNDSDVFFDTLFESNAKLYKIEGDGDVSTLAGATSMSIVMCTVGDKWKFLNGICFIQCSLNDTDPKPSKSTTEPSNMIWIYPLIPTVTTCYRTEYGAFIFPDLESDKAGDAFGIMLAEEGGAAAESQEDIQQFFIDLLEAILAGVIEELKLPSDATRPVRDTSQQVSKHIVCAADFIAVNLIKGAEKTGELMMKTTPYIISKLSPAAPDAPPVSPAVQTGVEVAKNVTSVAAGVTGWVAGKVGSASLALGRYLAPHIQTQGSNILQKGFGYDSNEANSKMESAFTIAAGAVEGVTTVYNGLEETAKILGTHLSDNSVKIIEHKYGNSAGNVASGAFDTIGNAFNVSQNVNYITPKGIAKKMVKNTGKAVVDDYKQNLREPSDVVPAGLLYPDLRSLKDT